MNVCNKILVRYSGLAVMLSLILGVLFAFGFGIEPNIGLAVALTTGSFVLMMALAINRAYRAGSEVTRSNDGKCGEPHA